MMYDIIVLLVLLVVIISLLIKWHKEGKTKVDDDIIPVEPEDYKKPFTQFKKECDEPSEEVSVEEPEIKTAEEYRGMDKTGLTDRQIKEGIDSYISYWSPKGSTNAIYSDSPVNDGKFYYQYILDNKEELKSKGFVIRACDATKFSSKSVALVWGDTSEDNLFNTLYTEEL